MVPPPRHRHQSSLEGIISFSDEPPLEPNERARLNNKFQRIVNHFDANMTNTHTSAGGYNRPRLVRLTYEYARSEVSKDIFLRAFLWAMGLSLNDEDEDDIDFENGEEELSLGLSRFADYLFENFFLPLRASALKTPQFSPAIHSAIQRAQGGAREFIGTPERIEGLRQDCLVRDRHRCVISRQFDLKEAIRRIEAVKRSGEAGANAEDDDGNRLSEDKRFAKLEVAHILPHSLTDMGSAPELPPSKKAALEVLNMFDRGVTDFIQGTDIDRPRNAITLSSELHQMFGNFEVFFEALPGQEHTYRVQTFLEPYLLPDLPVERTLYLTEDRSVEPPLPRMLALHSAIAHILHLSAAGNYIDEILRDLDYKDVREDGATELGHLVTLRLDGWMDAVST